MINALSFLSNQNDIKELVFTCSQIYLTILFLSTRNLKLNPNVLFEYKLNLNPFYFNIFYLKHNITPVLFTRSC